MLPNIYRLLQNRLEHRGDRSNESYIDILIASNCLICIYARKQQRDSLLKDKLLNPPWHPCYFNTPAFPVEF